MRLNHLDKSRISRNDNKTAAKIELTVEIMLFHIYDMLLAIYEANDPQDDAKHRRHSQQ